MVKRNGVGRALRVTGDGIGVANHAGARLLADLADAVGLTACVVGGDGADQAAPPGS